VGRTNLAGEQMCIGRGIAGLRSRFSRPYTLFHQIRSANEAWAPFEAGGTIFGSINRGQLESIELCAVPDDRAERLENQLQAIEGRISAALIESRKLAAARDELLPLLMSGRIRVRDAEKVVEEVT
jgi:type I restriction enzyme S subunit